ncbi:hypothetical protein TNIN_452701 [Trichonephila inaurata madagascariensis]|uniref:Uncharacterized protein n=1 Tax=Trichonephila inaurata madagascariensis TaxID=2747483 RepID=A0A8X6YUN4_9ARAC|nr:hypothetical protein TNIN_452701 [Trichonephila inaurata madagascariensis]
MSVPNFSLIIPCMSLCPDQYKTPTAFQVRIHLRGLRNFNARCSSHNPTAFERDSMRENGVLEYSLLIRFKNKSNLSSRLTLPRELKNRT